MKKNLFKVITAFLVVIVVILFSSNGFSASKVFKYRLITGSPPGIATSKELQNWVDEVKKATNGRLVIECFFGGALGKSPDTLDMLKSGVAEIALEGHVFWPNKFPISDVISLPFLISSPSSVGELFNQLYSDNLLKEWDFVKVIAFKPYSPSIIILRNKPADQDILKGLKLSTNGGMNSVKTLEKLGATPTVVAVPEIYTSLERGIIDGLVTSISFYYLFNLYEVAKYIVPEANSGNSTLLFMSMKAWNKLPSDIQLIIEELGRDFYWCSLKTEKQRMIDYMDKAKEKGATIIQLTEKERKKWKEATAPIIDEWIQKMKHRNLPGRQVVDRALLIEKAK
jgi:TRAP-type C4-dicarboxylate transport system substrate-binding protein